MQRREKSYQGQELKQKQGGDQELQAREQKQRKQEQSKTKLYFLLFYEQL